MRDRKLYDLLRRLSPEERALFAEFLRSPLHAHRPKLADMVQLMETILFATPDRECSSEEFYAAFYPGKPFDGNNLNRLISVITAEFKEFLALRFFQRDRTARTACATREMSRRRWDDILPKEIALTRKALQEELPDDEHNYYQLYCLEYENARHYIESSAQKGALIYQPMSDAIDKWFILLKSKLVAITSVYDRKFNVNHQVKWQELLSSPSSLSTAELTSTPKLYQVICSIFQNELNFEQYESFTQQLEKELPYYEKDDQPLNGGRISKTDAETLIELGQSMATTLSRNNREFQHIEHLRSVRHGIEKGILLNNGVLQPAPFQNYIRIAAAMGKLESAWDFLHRNTALLPEKDQEFIPALTMSTLYIIEGNANAALKILLKLKPQLNNNNYFWNHLETRMLLCQVWHMQGDFDSLHHEANAMRTFLDRIKLASKQSTITYRRFLQAIMAIESAERRVAEKRIKKYEEILHEFETKEKFTGITLLRREIQKRISGKTAF